MRAVGFALTLLGLLVAVVAMFSGCSALFNWNGKHAVVGRPLAEGASNQELPVVGGRRYTVGVQVVFDRAALETKEDGNYVVEAEMPLVVRVKDKAGTVLAETTGWLDPNKRPNVLYGQAARDSVRGPPQEVVVERLVGPFAASGDAPLTLSVDLGADRLGTTRILERRLVVFDDELPPGIRNSFVVAGVAGVVFVSGIVLMVVGWFRTRRKVVVA